jgi:hypothetical protein
MRFASKLVLPGRTASDQYVLFCDDCFREMYGQGDGLDVVVKNIDYVE